MLDATVHLIQEALTPVFLLSGIAALLNLYAGRQTKVSDRLDSLTGQGKPGSHSDPVCDEIRRLHRRSLLLDTSVILGTAGAAAICVNILSLFLFGLSNQVMASLLLSSFGIAVVSTLSSIAVFGAEMLVSSRALRIRMHFHLPALANKRSAASPAE